MSESHSLIHSFISFLTTLFQALFQSFRIKKKQIRVLALKEHLVFKGDSYRAKVAMQAASFKFGW
jgi:hypothetical protein